MSEARNVPEIVDLIVAETEVVAPAAVVDEDVDEAAQDAVAVAVLAAVDTAEAATKP